MLAAHARTFREYWEYHLKTNIPDKHPILAWFVDYAGTLITLFSNGEPKDGLTPIQRMKGKLGVRRYRHSWRRSSTSVGLRISLKVVGKYTWVFVVRRQNGYAVAQNVHGLCKALDA